MEVYLMKQDDMRRVPESDLESEANLEQRLVRTQGATIGGVDIMYVGRQGSPGEGGIFDILGVDERGDTVVVELKRDRAPRDIVAQALEYASEIRNVDYAYLDDQYRTFIGEEYDGTGADDVPPLRDAHASHFDLDEPLSEREFNDEQRLVVVGSGFGDLALNMADFLRDHGIDVVAVEHVTYQTDDEGVELLTTDAVRRPLSLEPTPSASSSSGSETPDYSEILVPLRERIVAALPQSTRVESPEEMTLRGNRTMWLRSNHPEHPDNAIYVLRCRVDEPDKPTSMNLNIWGGDEATKEQIRSVADATVSELEGFEVTGSFDYLVKSIDLGYEMSDSEIESVVDDFATFVETMHPRLVEGVDVDED